MRIRSVRRALSIVAAPIALLWAGCSREAPPPAVPAPAAAPTPLPDADGDGVADVGDDKCLLQKEDGLPPDPDDGCKSADPDGDELLGDADRCPLEREDRLPPDPNDGCASVDPDGDNIIGAADKCPKEKETVNGFQDDDGCADAAPRVRVAGNEVKINDKIHFAFGEATIEPESQGLLREIALVINNNPQIEHMEVAGHADKMGTDAANVALSKSRAHAVLDALVKLGDRKSVV